MPVHFEEENFSGGGLAVQVMWDPGNSYLDLTNAFFKAIQSFLAKHPPTPSKIASRCSIILSVFMRPRLTCPGSHLGLSAELGLEPVAPFPA